MKGGRGKGASSRSNRRRSPPSLADRAEAEGRWLAETIVNRAVPLRVRVLGWLLPSTNAAEGLCLAVPPLAMTWLCVHLSLETGTVVWPGWTGTGLVLFGTFVMWACWRVGSAGRPRRLPLLVRVWIVRSRRLLSRIGRR